MALATTVSLSEYLRSDFEPDAEYVDGEIEERPVGERDHSGLQINIATMLNTKTNRSWIQVFTELRVQISSQRFRVPDICLLRANAPKEQIVQTPPLLCIEVLSPEDTVSRTLVRVRDFLTMGIPQVWIVDSPTRSIQVCTGSTITVHTTGDLPIPETSISVSLAEVFSVLDE